MREGNLKNYLIYAVGEILLVMIGILLALQVNNWNNERVNRELEQYYLNRILEDLTADSVLLERMQRAWNRQLMIMDAVLTTMGNSPVQMREDPIVMKAHAMFPDQEKLADSYPFRRFSVNSLEPSFTEQLDVLRRIRRFGLEENTFQELSSNGKLEVIKDRTLRASIVEHYTTINDPISIQSYSRHPQDEYLRALYVNGISPLTSLTYDQFKAQASDEEILITLIEHLYSALIIQLDVFIYTETSIKKRTKEMMAKIENYRSGL